MRMASLLAGFLFLSCLSSPAAPSVRRFRGEDLSEGIIDSLNLTNKKIMVTDFMGEINNNFPKYERRRGIRGPYYIRFNLRDSKLRCIVSKYDRKNFDIVRMTARDTRVTVVGRIEQLAFGMERFSNPYYIMRVDHFEEGWPRGGEEDIFAGFESDAEYVDLPAQDLTGRPEKYAGEYLRVRDRFSARSDFFTEYERDLNLDAGSAIKFYLEDCPWPCYMPNSERNREILDRFASGDPMTVCGRLNLVTVGDDALLLFSVSRVKIGW